MTEKDEKKLNADQTDKSSDIAQLVKLLTVALNDLKSNPKPKLVGSAETAEKEYKKIKEALSGFTTGDDNRWELPPLSPRADTAKG